VRCLALAPLRIRQFDFLHNFVWTGAIVHRSLRCESTVAAATPTTIWKCARGRVARSRAHLEDFLARRA
jgi:hypothetical protein